MKHTLKTFPMLAGYEEYDRLQDCIENIKNWRDAFEKELRVKIAYHEKTLKFWEGPKALKHNLAKYRNEIASEWRVSLAQLKEILGDE